MEGNDVSEAGLPPRRPRGATTPSPVDRHLGGASRTTGLYLPRYTHEDLDRMIDERAGRAARFATLVVASASSSERSKASADFVCSGRDDQLVFERALAALPVWGGRIVALEGEFYVSNLSLYKAQVTLQGMGASTFFNRQEGSGVALATGGAGNVIRDLVVDEYSSSTSALVSVNGLGSSALNIWAQNGNGPGIELTADQGAVVGCRVSSCDTGIEVDGMGWELVSECYVEASSARGIFVTGTAHRTQVLCNQIVGGKTGIETASTSKSGMLSHNVVDYCNESGLYVAGSDFAVTGNRVSRCSQTTHNTYDAIVTGGVRHNVQGNTVRHEDEAKKHRYGIRVTGTDMLVTNNDLKNSGATASLNDAGTGTITAAGNRV